MNPLPPVLPIQPFRQPVRGSVAVPGSKSLTNRALLLAALSEKPVTLTGALFSDDTRLMAAALQRMGFTVDLNEAAATARVSGWENAFPDRETELFVGLAGTAARFLTALAAAAPRGVYRIDGVPQMRKRPMRPLLEALRGLGADITCTGEEGFFPIVVRAKGLTGARITLDASESSQLLSALLMIAPLCRGEMEIRLVGEVRRPFVDMTARLMTAFGQPRLQWLGDRALRVATGVRYRLAEGAYAIEPDATAASYFLALPLVSGGALSLPGLVGPGGGLQGDTQFLPVLEAAGLTVHLHPDRVVAAHEPGGARRGVAQDFSAFSDTFLTLAAIAPLLDGPTRITGIAHTRKQETDRVAGAARELARLGQEVRETENTLEIDPRPLRAGVEIETYGDHRFAMSFAILGCHDLHGNGQPWLSVKDPACCAKTFPAFFDLLERLRAGSH